MAKVKAPSREERLRDFCHHDIDADTRLSIAAVRSEYYALACTLLDWLPESHELGLALTYLEESLMRAVQCLEVCMPGSTRLSPQDGVEE